MESRGEFKTCPVCKTSVFADMEVCFNCMYRFGSNEKLESVTRELFEAAGTADVPVAASEAHALTADNVPATVSRGQSSNLPPSQASDLLGSQASDPLPGQPADLTFGQASGLPREHASDLPPEQPTDLLYVQPAGLPRGQPSDLLLGEFLVEFEGFLRNFLANRVVDVE